VIFLGSKIERALLNLLFPQKCIFCGDILLKQTRVNDSLRICQSCGKKVLNHGGDTSFESNKTHIGYVIAPLSYQDEKVARSLRAYKFHSKRIYGKTFGEIMADAVLKNEALFRSIRSYIVCSVPLSKERMLERGFNQSDILAKEVAVRLGFSYQKDVLTKVRHTERQSHLHSELRMKNIEGAYIVTKDVVGQKILLVDDIYTTGSTLNECAKMLFEAGASDIVGFCCAINRDFTVTEEKLWQGSENDEFAIW
jgi:Predicted amidophosphoribosyltransferases